MSKYPFTQSQRVERMNEVRKRRGVTSPIRIAWMGSKKNGPSTCCRPMRLAASRGLGAFRCPMDLTIRVSVCRCHVRSACDCDCLYDGSLYCRHTAYNGLFCVPRPGRSFHTIQVLPSFPRTSVQVIPILYFVLVMPSGSFESECAVSTHPHIAFLSLYLFFDFILDLALNCVILWGSLRVVK
jgi:hypothetical protein